MATKISRGEVLVKSAIPGVGQYVPSKVVTNDDLAQMFDTSDEWIRPRTGIEERRFIEHSGIGPSDLAVPAVQEAPASGNISRITHEMIDNRAFIPAMNGKEVFRVH